jgi:predicted dienelactone hydrolase
VKLTTRNAFDGAAPALGAALANRCRLLAALIAVTAGLGLAMQMPAEATAADGAGLDEKVRVGHKIEEMVVPGTELCTDPTQLCTRENRKVSVHLWYPADPAQPPGKNARYESQLHGSSLPEPLLALSWKLHGELARDNAAIDPSGGAFPVIVFSHGDRNDPIDYAHTLERIAAGGFIVAAPYHTNNTQDDVRRDAANTKAQTMGVVDPVFPCEDGRPSPCSRTSTNSTTRPNAIPLGMADRVRDIDWVLDKLPGWFGDRVDVNRAGLLGHSRGTVTALAAAGGSLELDDDRTSEAAPGSNPPRPPTCQVKGPNPIVVPGADDEPLCWPLHKQGLTRVKAVMGMAIGAPVLNRAVNLENVLVPTRLVSGSLDRTSPPVVSDTAHSLIGSTDKQRTSVDGAGHRSFASTYCDQTQAAAASADDDDEGRIGNGDGTVDGLELQDWQARAFLDHHTARETVLGAGNARDANNSVTQFCASETFTSPVVITSVVESLLGQPFDPASTPATGFVDSDTVKQNVAEAAVQFFGPKLAAAG